MFRVCDNENISVLKVVTATVITKHEAPQHHIDCTLSLSLRSGGGRLQTLAFGYSDTGGLREMFQSQPGVHRTAQPSFYHH